MTALLADQDVVRKEDALTQFPVTTLEVIYKGALVCVDTDGYLLAAADTAGYKFVGIAYEKADNATGDDAAKSCRVYTKGVFLLTCTGITQAMVGQLMYITDDDVVDNTSTNWICAGRLVKYVDGTSGWVDIGDRTREPSEPVYSADQAVSEICVETWGSDTEGNGTKLAPYLTITKAFTMVTAARKIVLIGPGTFAEAATLDYPTVDNVIVKGAGNNLTSISATGTSVILVTPGVQTGTWEGTLEGVHVDHSAGASQSGVKFSNAAMTKKLIFYLNYCSYECDDSADKSIDVATHTDTGNAIRIYVKGDSSQMEIEGAVYFETVNNGDRLHFENCWLAGTITTKVQAIEFRIRLYRCIVPNHAATGGGNGMQYITACQCYSYIDYDDLTPEIFEALDTSDLVGSHSEVIVD